MENQENKGCLFFFLGNKGTKTKPKEKLPYQRKYLVSKAELSFFNVLKQIIGNEYEIMTKIRLEDIIQVKKGTENYSSFRGKIKSRHIDFAICEPQNLYVKCIIELDDKSHEKEETKEKDKFINEALKSAGIKIIRIPASYNYNTDEISEIIKTGLN